MARATLVLSLEDFRFFADEFELSAPPIQVRADTRYVAIQLIEVCAVRLGLCCETLQVGGDHLDDLRCWHNGHPSAALEPAVRPGGGQYESCAAGAPAHCAGAWVGRTNAVHDQRRSDLPGLGPHREGALSAGPAVGHCPEWAEIVVRWEYLEEILPDGHRALVVVSRLPDPDILSRDEATGVQAVPGRPGGLG